jgi:hypothetical protein
MMFCSFLILSDDALFHDRELILLWFVSSNLPGSSLWLRFPFARSLVPVLHVASATAHNWWSSSTSCEMTVLELA